jgi:hypothetical protein
LLPKLVYPFILFYKLMKKAGRLELLKSCSLFIAGWLAAHQWFLHQHSTLDIEQESHSLHSPHAALLATTSGSRPVSSSAAPSTISSANIEAFTVAPVASTVVSLDDLRPLPWADLSEVNVAVAAASLDGRGSAVASSWVHPGLLAKPSWHRLLDCSVAALPDCFNSPGAYAEYPAFESLNLEDFGPTTTASGIYDRQRDEAQREAAAKARQTEIDAAMDAALQRMTSTTTADAQLRAVDAGALNPGKWACAAAGARGGAKRVAGEPASNEADAYDAALAGLAADAAHRPGLHRAAFTMADKNYAHQISEV